MNAVDLDTRSRVEHIMGMPIGIDLRDEAVDPAVLSRAFALFREVDAVFSTYRPDSEISRLNRGELTRRQAGPELHAVLARCEDLRIATGGYFDIAGQSLPLSLRSPAGELVDTGLDPSGYVKGWAVQRAGALLEEAGARNFSINAGGDLLVRGGALPADHWRVGIQHPFERLRVAAVAALTDTAMATSGAYARGCHILDPHTGAAPQALLSATVTGPDLGTADAYATALFAMGHDAPAFITRLFGYEAMLIMADERVFKTRWFPSV
jgi:FAD:protein FMN transferase